jgi:Ser/Thr protein kinase RdoA (MazF antagonist)
VTPEAGDVLTAPAPGFSAEKAARVAREVFGIRGQVETLEGERDQNFRIVSDGQAGYVVKIANRAEQPVVLDLQRSALQHLERCAPELRVPRVVVAPDGRWCAQVRDSEGIEHLVWLLTYLPGCPLTTARTTPALLRALGADVARLGRALRGFFHPAADRELAWDVKQTANLRDRLDDVEDLGRRGLAERSMDEFEARVLPALPLLRAQIIHNDANGANVLVDAPEARRVVGFIDFGDMVHTALLNDLAVTVASAVVDGARPIAAAAPIVVGYDSVTPLEREEVDLLFDFWKARLLAGVLISAWRSRLHPQNYDYITADDANAWPLLERFSRMDSEVVARELWQACRAERARTA